MGKDKPSSFVAQRVGKAEVCVDLAGLIDFDKEEGRLRKEEEKILKELSRIDATLTKPGFVDKAPKEVIEKQVAIKAELLEKLTVVQANVERLQALKARIK